MTFLKSTAINFVMTGTMSWINSSTCSKCQQMGQNKKRQESVNNLKIRGMFYCNKNKTKVLKIQLLDKNIGILSNH